MEYSFDNETILSAELGNYAYYDFLPVNIIIELDNRDKVPGRIFTKIEPLLPGQAEYSTIKIPANTTCTRIKIVVDQPRIEFKTGIVYSGGMIALKQPIIFIKDVLEEMKRVDTSIYQYITEFQPVYPGEYSCVFNIKPPKRLIQNKKTNPPPPNRTTEGRRRSYSVSAPMYSATISPKIKGISGLSYKDMLSEIIHLAEERSIRRNKLIYKKK